MHYLGDSTEPKDQSASSMPLTLYTGAQDPPTQLHGKEVVKYIYISCIHMDTDYMAGLSVVSGLRLLYIEIPGTLLFHTRC